MEIDEDGNIKEQYKMNNDEESWNSFREQYISEDLEISNTIKLIKPKWFRNMSNQPFS